MKKITFLAAIAVVFMLASCDKSKDCKCTSVQKWDVEEMEPMTSETTLHIKEGECSDNNVNQTMTDPYEGYTYTASINCVEI